MYGPPIHPPWLTSALRTQDPAHPPPAVAYRFSCRTFIRRSEFTFLSFLHPQISAQAASSSNPGIPPSSLMSLLRVKPSVSGLVVADFDSSFKTPYYQSEFDNGANVTLQVGSTNSRSGGAMDSMGRHASSGAAGAGRGCACRAGKRAVVSLGRVPVRCRGQQPPSSCAAQPRPSR